MGISSPTFTLNNQGPFFFIAQLCHSWNAKCPIFWGNFTPKTSNKAALKIGLSLAFQVVHPTQKESLRPVENKPGWIQGWDRFGPLHRNQTLDMNLDPADGTHLRAANVSENVCWGQICNQPLNSPKEILSKNTSTQILTVQGQLSPNPWKTRK